jgi:hypothetical protein
VTGEPEEIFGTFCPQSCLLALMLKPLVRRAAAILMTTMRRLAGCTIRARLAASAYVPITELLLCTRLLRLLPTRARRPANSQVLPCQSADVCSVSWIRLHE